MNVLIAEDDATTRRILERSVEVCGHTPLVARDGLEAWELFGQAEADVIITDWLMPGIDGLELCRRVRASASRAVPYTYVIILTALEDREHMRAAMEVGADDYLTKPLNREDLRMRLSVADRVTAVYRRLVIQQGELERSNGELQQFAYVASHDLQEPLRTVTSYLALLQRRYQGRLGDDADTFIGYATDGAQRMSTLIKAVLAYSRVGTHGAAFGPADCAALVGAATANLEARIAETGARVVHEALPTVHGDAAQLGQLFQNLIGNALKFTRPGVPPQVRVSAERQGGRWLVRVADNGIGIAPAHAGRIFQMFGRLHTRDEYEGTGIGLAVCQRIVERHGGRIWVESAPGQGATFLFTLPALPTRADGDASSGKDDREDAA